MAGKKSKAAYWSFLASNDKLKAFIRHKMEQNNMTQKDLAKELGFHESRLSSYLNNKPRGLTDIQLVWLVQWFGWDIDLQFNVLNDEFSE